MLPVWHSCRAASEMLTDTLRALLARYGYETKVFEFVSLEHTSK